MNFKAFGYSVHIHVLWNQRIGGMQSFLLSVPAYKLWSAWSYFFPSGINWNLLSSFCSVLPVFFPMKIKIWNLNFQRTYYREFMNFYWGFWRQCGQDTHSSFGFVVTCCVVSKQSLHLSLSPFLLLPLVFCWEFIRI